MTKKPDAKALLAALQHGVSDEDEPAPAPAIARPVLVAASAPATQPAPAQVASPQAARPAKPGKSKPPRSELKHIGGYLDDDTVEKVALLRIRLKLENSELLKLAIEELYRKHAAKRAFGDA